MPEQVQWTFFLPGFLIRFRSCSAFLTPFDPIRFCFATMEEICGFRGAWRGGSMMRGKGMIRIRVVIGIGGGRMRDRSGGLK